jgi:hypothetical protein
MFFIAGINSKSEQLDYYEPIMCSACTKYGRFEAFVEYRELSLFFIPIFRFGKKYYARTTCCNSLYLITNKEKCLMMERGHGHNVFLKDKDLMLIQKGSAGRTCPNCHNQVSQEHNYCPNCGTKL